VYDVNVPSQAEVVIRSSGSVGVRVQRALQLHDGLVDRANEPPVAGGVEATDVLVHDRPGGVDDSAARWRTR
jgi:hypothetical protein